MFANFIWWTAIALEVVILFRSALTGLLKKYPLFFTYIGCVLLTEIIGLLTNALAPKLYERLYWPADLATILASYAVMVEIFRWSTRHKPGIRRLTQSALLTVFALTIGYAASNIVHGTFSSPSRAVAALGRDLRYVEAGVLLLIGLLPATFLLTLGVWCVTLWSAHLEPMQPTETKIERDYELLAAKTQAVLARTSTRLVRFIRP